jgi:YcaO-like protein with predicted kinase domain
MGSPDEIGLPAPYSSEILLHSNNETVSVEELIASGNVPPAGLREEMRPAPERTFKVALAALEKVGILADKEMRHVASLSPIALMRRWKMNVSVDCGRHRYELSGIQTSYGRGLELEAARAACAMEMLERYASFASVGRNEVTGYQRQYPLVYARRSEMKKENRLALDPDRLRLEVPYRDEPVYWIEGEPAGNDNSGSVWVPAQSVFLFFNLDEIKLYSGLGSTGLAAGNTLAEAKASALLEIVERDCEAVSPFDPAKCFDIETADPKINSLLYNYAEAGIRVKFQDLTPPMGIPCCKSFVVAGDGEIVKGTGAHLDAKRALLSAMTETPYPFPYGPPGAAGAEKLVRVPMENLPDYSSGDPERDLALLETLLIRNGYEPIYVDLTREDTKIPVVRAIVPGMEACLDFDRYSRVPPRLFSNYLAMHGKCQDEVEKAHGKPVENG